MILLTGAAYLFLGVVFLLPLGEGTDMLALTTGLLAVSGGIGLLLNRSESR